MTGAGFTYKSLGQAGRSMTTTTTSSNGDHDECVETKKKEEQGDTVMCACVWYTSDTGGQTDIGGYTYKLTKKKKTNSELFLYERDDNQVCEIKQIFAKKKMKENSIWSVAMMGWEL